MPSPANFLTRRLLFSIGAGFALSLILMAALSFIGLHELADTNARMKRIVDENSVKSEAANTMRDLLRARAISMLSIVVMNDHFEKDEEMLHFYTLGEAYQKNRVKLDTLATLPEERVVLKRIDELTRINQPILSKTVELGMEGYTFLAFEILQNEAIPLQRQLVKEIDELVGIQRQATANASQQAERAYERTRWLMLVLGLSAAGVAGLVAALVLRRTARLAAETERERTRFQTLFETNTDGIVILNERGFVRCNPAVLAMFGLDTEDEFLQLSPASLGTPVQPGGQCAADMATHYIHQAFALGHATFEWEGKRLDDSTFLAEVDLHAMNLNGEPHLQCIIHDISAQKAAETALKNAHAEAIAAAELKSQFVANVSHEIRTPMNGIVGMTRLLLDSPLPEREHEFVEAVSQSADALMRIINDLLDFSKIEAGRLTVEAAPFDLQSLLRELIGFYRPRAMAKGLEFDLQTDTELPVWVRGDALRIRQILLNLLDNAIKFTAQGGITLLAGPVKRKSHPQVYRFTVRDTGVGIPAEAAERVFQAFAQADGSISRQYGGTGLGLAISRQLAGLMGGSLSFVSTAGMGSEFHLDLPLPTAPAVQPIAAIQTALPDFTGTCVLVAEDNVINQKLVQLMLESLGIEVTMVGDGKLAYQQLQKAGADLVLMDCQMPEWDGMTATRAIREWESANACRRTPIVALTANAMSGFENSCRLAGMDDYLTKPLLIEALAEMLSRLLPWHRHENAASQVAPASAIRQADSASYDLAKIEQLCKYDKAQIEEMLELFITSTDQLIAAIKSDFVLQAADKIARNAHQIKGAAAYMGAASLVSIAANLESAAKAAAWVQVEQASNELEVCHARLSAEMRAYGQPPMHGQSACAG